MEPVVREALELAAAVGELPWPDVEAVGGWWNRRFDPEVDLVGADRSPIARRLYFAGSVTWRSTPFDNHDLAALRNAAPRIPGFVAGSTGLVVVSLSGTRADLDGVDLSWRPADVVATWR